MIICLGIFTWFFLIGQTYGLISAGMLQIVVRHSEPISFLLLFHSICQFSLKLRLTYLGKSGIPIPIPPNGFACHECVSKIYFWEFCWVSLEVSRNKLLGERVYLAFPSFIWFSHSTVSDVYIQHLEQKEFPYFHDFHVGSLWYLLNVSKWRPSAFNTPKYFFPENCFWRHKLLG